jgi:hypothetical protein
VAVGGLLGAITCTAVGVVAGVAVGVEVGRLLGATTCANVGVAVGVDVG